MKTIIPYLRPRWTLSWRRALMGLAWVGLLALLTACQAEQLPITPTARNTPVLSHPTPLPINPTATGEAPPSLPSPTPLGIGEPSTASAPNAIPSRVAQFPDPGRYHWQTVVEGLRSPVGIAHAGDGSGRLFILEQQGAIRIVQEGRLVPEPFLDISPRVNSSGNEQGLLGLAFHPRFSENGYFYINYTERQGHTVIARFQAWPTNAERADPASEMRLLFIPQPYPNHNGGGMAFGPDGYLYLGLGDGGSAGDPQNNAQSLETLLGKLLRIDIDGGQPYAIPPDNPFVAGGGRGEIWAYGLRNPWRFAFDRLNGDLFIGDVGQNAWEEIDYLPAGAPGGANFGWRYFEGSHPYQGTPPPELSLTPPIAEYGHEEGCSVTGGVVYRGSSLPEWQGVYLYGDFCSGHVWGLLPNPPGGWQSLRLFQNVARITSFGEDEAGEVYLLDRNGALLRLSRR